MAKVILGTTMSLDGFMNDRDGSVARLYPDMDAMRESEVIQDAIRKTGAAVMGRHTYDMAQGDFTGYEFQVPIFVVTHQIPEVAAKGQNENLTLTYVTEGIESAIRQAKAAAGDMDVQIIGGANLAHQLIKAGLVDEIHIGIMPVLLGGGLRFFGESEPIELEKIRVMESTDGRTEILFRVVR